eukprot:Hpha_TRINITY_DN5574_c0_g1::TRINITY_DN5574_c0_g1_i1::g.93798::m.93798
MLGKGGILVLRIMSAFKLILPSRVVRGVSWDIITRFTPLSRGTAPAFARFSFSGFGVGAPTAVQCTGGGWRSVAGSLWLIKAVSRQTPDSTCHGSAGNPPRRDVARTEPKTRGPSAFHADATAMARPWACPRMCLVVELFTSINCAVNANIHRTCMKAKIMVNTISITNLDSPGFTNLRSSGMKNKNGVIISNVTTFTRTAPYLFSSFGNTRGFTIKMAAPATAFTTPSVPRDMPNPPFCTCVGPHRFRTSCIPMAMNDHRQYTAIGCSTPRRHTEGSRRGSRATSTGPSPIESSSMQSDAPSPWVCENRFCSMASSAISSSVAARDNASATTSAPKSIPPSAGLHATALLPQTLEMPADEVSPQSAPRPAISSSG